MAESLRDALERVRKQLRDSEDGGIEAAAYAEEQAAAFIEANYDALLAAVRDGERWQHFREHGEKVKAPYCLFEFGCAPEMLDAAVDDAILLAAELGSRNG